VSKFLVVQPRFINKSTIGDVIGNRCSNALALYRPAITEFALNSWRLNGGAQIAAFGASLLRHYDTAAAVGSLHSAGGGWSAIGSAAPEGSYALVRADNASIEVLTDAMATRSIWYFQSEDWFIASNSQRAIVNFLGSFQWNAAAVPWMLANGNPGPVGGWDARLKLVPAGGRVALNRDTWKLEVVTGSSNFDPIELSDQEHASRFRSAVEGTLAELELDTEKWILPLSGGYDSRLLACLLKDRKNLKAVTWGFSADLNSSDSEVAIARALADSLNLEHTPVALTLGDETIDVVMHRFVEMSEGRTDSLTGYLDGFRLWADLAKQGVTGIIRGDEPFGGYGWSPVTSEKDVRTGLGLGLLSENPALSWLATHELTLQELPEELARLPNETLENWRYRLYHDYRVSFVLSALNETKSSYVDVVNPLQFGQIVDVVRTLPAYLRRDKFLLIDLVKRLSPNIPYSTLREGDLLLRVLRRRESIEFLLAELGSLSARNLLGNDVVDGILDRLPTPSAKKGSSAFNQMDQWLRARLPRPAKRYLKRFTAVQSIDPCLLAFRAWITVRINHVLSEDARAGKYLQ
jgi:asparagine synthetase B (glutamine-hydrolysing)